MWGNDTGGKLLYVLSLTTEYMQGKNFIPVDNIHVIYALGRQYVPRVYMYQHTLRQYV